MKTGRKEIKTGRKEMKTRHKEMKAQRKEMRTSFPSITSVFSMRWPQTAFGFDDTLFVEPLQPGTLSPSTAPQKGNHGLVRLSRKIVGFLESLELTKQSWTRKERSTQPTSSMKSCPR
jgi:hypothetical protein